MNDDDERAIYWHRMFLEKCAELQRLEASVRERLEAAYDEGYERAIKMVAEGE